MSNVAAILKGLNAGIDETISSSANHGKLLAKWTIKAFLFATEHGQCGPLTRLYKNVNGTDQEGIRLFVANVIKVHGVAAEGDTNKRPVPYMKYSREDGFSLATYEDKSAQDVAAKAMKKKVIAEGEAGLAKIPLGRMGGNADDAMSNVFDVGGAVSRFIKTLVRNGEKALALQINRAVGQEYAVAADTIETLAKDNDPMAKLEAARKRVAALEADVERRKSKPANDDNA
jgi:hypothetical protein